MKVEGACHCGHITFEAEIDPEAVRVCHRTIARRSADPRTPHGTKSYGIRVGTHKRRALLPPKRQIWHRSALPWTEGLRAVPHIERQ